MMNSKRQHIPFNSSVMYAQSKCDFIPSCAYETIYNIEYMPDNSVVRVYISDNKQYMRAVLFNNKSDLIGLCGILINKNTNEIIYCETSEQQRGKGLYKQLRAYLCSLLSVELWSVHHTPTMLTTMAHKQATKHA